MHLFLVLCYYVPFPVTMCHYIPFPVTMCYYVPFPVTMCYYVPFPVIMCYFIRFLVTMCYYVPFPVHSLFFPSVSFLDVEPPESFLVWFLAQTSGKKRGSIPTVRYGSRDWYYINMINPLEGVRYKYCILTPVIYTFVAPCIKVRKVQSSVST